MNSNYTAAHRSTHLKAEATRLLWKNRYDLSYDWFYEQRSSLYPVPRVSHAILSSLQNRGELNLSDLCHSDPSLDLEQNRTRGSFVFEAEKQSFLSSSLSFRNNFEDFWQMLLGSSNVCTFNHSSPCPEVKLNEAHEYLSRDPGARIVIS